MSEFWPLLAIAGGYATVLGGFVWLAARVRRRGVSANLLGFVDEIYNPAAHRALVEVQVQYERQAPLPSAEDH